MSATRTYSSAGAVTTGFAVARQNLRLSRIFGNYVGAAGNYLQVHTTAVNNDGIIAAPQANATPVLSFVLPANYEFAELFNSGLPFIPGPVYVAISSVEATYTAVGVVTIDCHVEVEEWEIESPALTSTSTASGNHISPWTNANEAANGPYGLYQIIATDLNNSGGAQLYLMIFACDYGTLVAGMAPQMGNVFAIPGSGVVGVNINCSATILLNFGDSQAPGRKMLQQGLGTLSTVAPAQSATNYVGCTIVVSTSPTVFTLAAANAAKIYALSALISFNKSH